MFLNFNKNIKKRFYIYAIVFSLNCCLRHSAWRYCDATCLFLFVRSLVSLVVASRKVHFRFS